MHCDYDLHGKELYSVNWYKNDEMLFRYSPSLTPKGTVYPDESDVNVSLEESNGERLLILGHQDFRKSTYNLSLRPFGRQPSPSYLTLRAI
jgi:hypothetical protein